jgi:cytochrome c oxidase subunit 2
MIGETVKFKDYCNEMFTSKVVGISSDKYEDVKFINENFCYWSKKGKDYRKVKEKNINYLQQVDKHLIVPVNTKIRFLLTSNDVLHAWWVPDLALKKDAIPGYINEMSVVINEPGIYRGRCAELCGRHHGFMPIVIEAVEEKEYEKWLAASKVKMSGVAKINK